MRSVYLVTKQFGSSEPHERSVFEERDRAAFRAMELSGLRAPADLSDDAWARRQGNQHKPTQWWCWWKTDHDRVASVFVRKFTVGDES